MAIKKPKPWQFILLVYGVICLLMLFIPYYGHPNFRYEGADSNHDVWNFGFPLSTFIYDHRYGLIRSQMLPLTLIFQAGLFVLVVLPVSIFILEIQHSKKQKRIKEKRCTACGYDLRVSKSTCPECGTSIPKAS